MTPNQNFTANMTAKAADLFTALMDAHATKAASFKELHDAAKGTSAYCECIRQGDCLNCDTSPVYVADVFDSATGQRFEPASENDNFCHNCGDAMPNGGCGCLS